jgi:hypothetical protein
MKVVSRLAALCAVMVVASSGAWAQSVWDVEYTAASDPVVNVWVDKEGKFETAFAGGCTGEVKAIHTGSTISVDPGYKFLALCVDLSGNITLPWKGTVNVAYNPVTPPTPAMSAAAWARVCYIYRAILPTNPTQGTVPAAAAQLAIWHVLGGGDLEINWQDGTSTNPNHISNNIALQARNLYNGSNDAVLGSTRLPDGSTLAPVLFFSEDSGKPGNTQAFIGLDPTKTVTVSPVPEASSLLLLLPGLVPLGLLARKRSKA